MDFRAIGGVVYSERMNMHTEIPRDAPSFGRGTRSDYPLSGEKTGPAWRALWALLRVSPDLWRLGSSLIDSVVADLPDANRETVRNLLYGAARAGILEREMREAADLPDRRKRAAHFRIKR